MNDRPMRKIPVPNIMANSVRRCKRVRFNMLENSSPRDCCSGGHSRSGGSGVNNVRILAVLFLALAVSWGGRLLLNVVCKSVKRVRADVVTWDRGASEEEGEGDAGGGPCSVLRPSRRPIVDAERERSMQDVEIGKMCCTGTVERHHHTPCLENTTLHSRNREHDCCCYTYCVHTCTQYCNAL